MSAFIRKRLCIKKSRVSNHRLPQENTMPYTYILKCCDDSFYTGSTLSLEKRLAEHNAGEGANYTSKRLPLELVYYEEYDRIDDAFNREKQIQGWTRKKKMALIDGKNTDLPVLAKKIFYTGGSIQKT